MSTAPSEHVRHQLEVASPSLGELQVHAFRGVEELTGLFRFDLDVSGPREGAPTIADDALGQSATLHVRAGEAHRTFSGFVAGVRVVAHHGASRRAQYRVRLVPRLALLRLKHRTRVFQRRRVSEVIESVLSEVGVPSVFATVTEQPTREYCTQFEETDWAFIRRLAAEAGLMFRVVEGPGGVASLAFGDSPALYRGAASVALRYTGESGIDAASSDVLESFVTSHLVRPNAAHYREFDFTRPNAPLVASASEKGELAVGGLAAGDLEHYAHHAPFQFTKWPYGEQEPARMLRQLRQKRHVADGRSLSPLVQSGHLIRVEHHPLASANAEYAVTRVEHEGGDSTDGRKLMYANRFRCVPHDVAHCLPRPKRRSVGVTLTATVVGAASEEIHTEPGGQIKVQFHWDRDGKMDDRSSCWLRTMQPWAGAGWGTQFIPRVGMEVVVSFDGGDPDRPFVLGALYNGTHPPPFPLPAEADRSGIRTQSTPAAEGFNELSFSDRAGEEQIYLHAQADLDEKIGRDHTTQVDRDESEVVSRNQSSRVLGNRTLETLGAMVTKTLGSSEEHVGGLRTERAGGGRRVTVQGDDTTRTTGRSVHDVGQAHNMKVGTNFGLEVGRADKPGTFDVYAFGNAMIGAGLGFTVRADKKIVLTCGDSTLELSKDTIRIASKKVRIEAENELLATGEGPKLRLDKKAEITGEEVRLYSKKASLELDDSAHLDGQMVKIACGPEEPSTASSAAAKAATQRLDIKLTDAALEPYANKEFVVKAGGVRVEGTTGGDGKIGVDVPADATTADITLWLEKRPTGATRRYSIELKPLPPTSDVVGLQTRLRHLGYLHRAPSGELDEATKGAIREFQRDHGLDVTGEPDAKTQSKIEEVHGS